MEMMIHCSGCRVLLRVPRKAAGKSVRCPACQTIMAVPSGDDLYDETISCWIEAGVDFEQRQRESHFDSRIRELPGMRSNGHASEASGEGGPKSSVVVAEAGTVRDGAAGADAGYAAGDDEDVDADDLQALLGELDSRDDASSSGGEDAVDQDAAQPDAARSEASSDESFAFESSTTIEQAAEASAGQTSGDAAPAPSDIDDEPSAGAQALEGDLQYPSVLLPGDRPYLLVEKVTPNGVTLAFDSQWLTDEGFRASLPMACLFSGQMDRAQLLARPMIFSDQKRTATRAAEQIESHYEQLVGDAPSTRHLLSRMGLIDELAYPFDQPMVYFIARDHRSASLRTKTTIRGDGAVTCHISIPQPRLALQWLANVNGLCGPEYLLLSEDIALAEGDAWMALPELVRQRLGAWCVFEPREQFRLYLPDADFGSRESGLAGLVVTDRRIIYHKYHHNGAVRLADEATLQIHRREGLAAVVLNVGQHRARCCKITVAQISTLLQVLGDSTALQISVV